MDIDKTRSVPMVPEDTLKSKVKPLVSLCKKLNNINNF